MGTQVQNGLDLVHPVLKGLCIKIQQEVIIKHDMPFKLFETGRSPERHQHLLSKGRTQNILTKHLYDLTNKDKPLYAAAVDYVYYDGKWSWNLRDQTILSWYLLFGNMVLDLCPELEWSGCDRKQSNYTHFQIRDTAIADVMDVYPCIIHP